MGVAEHVVGSIWASMASWFTPTVLFCLLNLMIGTIFITSNFKPHPKHHRPEGEPHPPHLARAPSLLERVRSINLSLHRSNSFEPHTQLLDPHHEEALTKQPELDTVSDLSQHVYPPSDEIPTKQPEREAVPGPTRLARTPSLLERVWSNIPIGVNPADEEVSTGETGPTRIAQARSILEQMSSINFSFRRSDPVEAERSDTHDHHVTRSKSAASGGERAEPTRIRKSASERAMLDEEDEGVDAKADDFINRFKQQLKLQRLDSLLRFREMTNRGAGR